MQNLTEAELEGMINEAGAMVMVQPVDSKKNERQMGGAIR